MTARTKLMGSTRHIRRDQSGFTLLELLVTVGIMAAVAGTATLALQDTTARASAAAHVLMMDELNEGVRTFRVLRENQYPNNFDSLLLTETAGDTTAAVLFSAATNADDQEIVAIEDITAVAIDQDLVDRIGEIGITELQYADTSLDPADDGDCSAIQALINSRGNAVVAGNIFLTDAGNGCGFAGALVDTSVVAFWTGGQERLTGQPGVDDTTFNTDGNTAFLAVGFGPASTLFDANSLSGLTSVPVYRHVAADQYNRFIGIFDVGTFDVANGGTDGIVPKDQVSLVTVVDGAGDTKEEELGEWDGTRNTI